VVQSKQCQRALALARRDAVASAVRVRVAKSLVSHLDLLMGFVPCGKIFAGFWPIRSEIDPRPLMFALAEKGRRLALPALIERRGERWMVFRAFEPGQDLVAMGFGTSGPGEGAGCVDPDVVLLPLAAFDAGGNRIGYGGGFYDRTLAQMRARGMYPQLVGLAFDVQEVDAITAEPHDISLDAILTESGLRIFDKKNKAKR